MKSQDRDPTLGETSVEDFLVQAGLFAETYLNHSLRLDSIEVENPQNIPQKVSLSSSSSVDALSDTTMVGRKRDALDTFETTIERRLKRKIKNRESAARSRARKQAYYDELVSKVSRLEQENIKLKKEKDFAKMYPYEAFPEPKYQLRRTMSF